MSSIILYGPPGGGKTTLASTLCKIGYRLDVLDMDRKIRGMGNLHDLVEKGLIKVTEPTSKLLDTSLKIRVLGGMQGNRPKTQPKGYLELIDWINDLEENPPEDAYLTIPVIDSISRVLEHLMRLILHIQGKNIFTFDEYKFLKSNLEELFDSFFSLQPDIYPHCILICHDMVEKDETTGKIKVMPLIDGSFREKVGMYASEMYYCTTEADKQGTVEFIIQTKPVGNIVQARSSYGADTYLAADLSEIFPPAPKRD